jgi:hypothetical protein
VKDVGNKKALEEAAAKLQQPKEEKGKIRGLFLDEALEEVKSGKYSGVQFLQTEDGWVFEAQSADVVHRIPATGDVIVEVMTMNTVYSLVLVDAANRKFAVHGTGSHFGECGLAILLGSTWGGSMLRMNWIGTEMHLQLCVRGNKNPQFTTSPVRTVKIITDQKERAKDILERATQRGFVY